MLEGLLNTGLRLRRDVADEAGEAGTEWVVAAAIVVLFAIPVLTLISSGTDSNSAAVSEALSNPETAAVGSGYAPTEDEARRPEDEQGSGATARSSSGGGSGTGGAVASLPGLDMGVGFDITEAQAKSGYSGASSANGRSSGSGGSGVSAAGPTSRSATNPETSTNPGTSTNRPVLIASVQRRDKPEVRKADVVSASVKGDPQGRGADSAANPDGFLDPDSVRDIPLGSEVVDIHCETVSRPKFLEREPEFGLGGGIDEDLYVEQTGVNSGDDIFSDGEIHFTDDGQVADSSDCGENRALVTAAGEQLGDGTILGMVTISASEDTAPDRRAAPSSLGERTEFAAQRQIREDEKINSADAVRVATDDAAEETVEIMVEFDAITNSGAGRGALAEVVAMVEYTAPKSPVVRQSGR